MVLVTLTPALRVVKDAWGQRDTPPGLAPRLSPYCSYFTSHRYVVYSPTKKGWSFG